MAASATTAIQSGHTLNDWRPDDDAFWNESGRSIAKRNLWISIPCLLLAFSVWMVWSVVVMMRGPPGLPVTMKRFPSRSTTVGVMLERGRLRGATALAPRVSTRP